MYWSNSSTTSWVHPSSAKTIRSKYPLPSICLSMFLAAVENTRYPTSPRRLINSGESAENLYIRRTALYLPSTSTTEPDTKSSLSIWRGAISPLYSLTSVTKLGLSGCASYGNSRGIPYGPVYFGSLNQPVNTRSGLEYVLSL